MSERLTHSQNTRGHRAVRVVVLINFVLVVLCLVSATRNIMEQIFRALEPYPLLPWFFDLWIVGSTLFATGLFGWGWHKERHRESPSGRSSKPLVLDGMLLLAWWLTLAVFCAYGFMLGMAA